MLDPWILVGGLMFAFTALGFVLAWILAWPVAVAWSRRRKARAQDRAQVYREGWQAGLDAGLVEVRSRQVVQFPPPARRRNSHEDPTRIRTSPSPIGKRWRPGITHTTAMPAVTPHGETS